MSELPSTIVEGGEASPSTTPPAAEDSEPPPQSIPARTAVQPTLAVGVVQ
ncbi:MAG: hypothetical protein GF403_08700 [Candidatus Coatesbacteria bacterium]|jgi:hypothetical protein|nr:hypothetical protein [Candidatus Coatesbacteria bacterium]